MKTYLLKWTHQHRRILLAPALWAALAVAPVFGGDNDYGSSGFAAGGSGGGPVSLPVAPPGTASMSFRTIAIDDDSARDSIWLGVAVSDTTDPLSAQLGLKRGEGLVVNLVSTNSPAAAAGLQENDVLVELDGQMLVDPAQLRKLVQMHAEGDSIKIAYYRAGKRESVSAKLAKMPPQETLGPKSPWPYRTRLSTVHATPEPWAETQLKADAQRVNAEEERVTAEIQRAVAEAQLAVKDALKKAQDQSGNLDQKLKIIHQKLGSLADGGVDLSNSATVVVRNDSGSVRTLVKKDESGTYILVADPTKRLTAHDPEGKLLFDGPVDSPEEQKKVPAGVWNKAESMLNQIDQNPAPAGGLPDAP